MALQNTDSFLVQRGGASYKMEASNFVTFLDESGFGSSSVTISETAPADPEHGDMWWNSVDGNLYIYYQDVDTSQWVPANGDGGGGGFVNASVGPNVPAAASAGDLWYSTSDARLYIYDGAVWIDASPAAAPNISTISDTAPSTPASGDLWYDLDSARLYVYNGQFWVDSAPGYGIQDGAVGGAQLADDINIVTTGDITATSYNSGQLGGFRNLLINGDLRIWQRGTTFNNTGSGQYLADRWFVLGTDADFSKETLSSGKPYMRMVAPNSGAAITQRIEIQNLYGLEGKELTFSVSVKTANPDDVKFIGITYRQENGNYISLVVDESEATGLTANAWGRISKTFTLPAIPSNAGCLQIGVMNDTTNQTMDVSDFQLEVGPVATPFELRPIGMEMSLCQRYFIRTTNRHAIWTGMTVSGKLYSVSSDYPVQMRATPTIENVTSQAQQNFNTPELNVANFNSATFVATATATIDGNYYWVGFDANAEL